MPAILTDSLTAAPSVGAVMKGTSGLAVSNAPYNGYSWQQRAKIMPACRRLTGRNAPFEGEPCAMCEDPKRPPGEWHSEDYSEPFRFEPPQSYPSASPAMRGSTSASTPCPANGICSVCTSKRADTARNSSNCELFQSGERWVNRSHLDTRLSCLSSASGRMGHTGGGR